MAVREHGEIKGIQGIAVQEGGTTVVSSADTVNIVGGGTVTDVGGVATINIPEGVTWIREDVPAGSATYTFVNSPASSTSFLIFTDSGTLLFLGVDYTYDPDTETVTFLSLGANEAAYIWNAHTSTQGGGIGDMVKAVYDPTNINSSAFDYNNFINTPIINTKAFFLEDLQDLTTAQDAYDWATSGDGENVPIIVYDGGVYLINHVDEAKWTLCSTGFHNGTNNSYTERTQNNLIFFKSGDTITNISTGYGGTLSMYYLSTGTDYPTPYTPLYDGSPATKKYVDDSIADFVEGQSSSTDGNIVVFDGATGKVVKDSGLNIQTTSSVPVGASICDVYYNNGTIYLYTNAVRDNIILES